MDMDSTGNSEEKYSLSPSIVIAAAAVTFLFSMFFAFYTSHAWEDWYITYRAAKNLATGYGLVFTVGERLHTFTSPLGTIIPALLNVVTGNRSDELVLWLYRLIGSALLALASVLLFKSAHKTGMSLYASLVMAAFFASDAKIIDFTINGQETGFMMFFLAATIYLLTVPTRHSSLLLGLSWGGILWTRPDGFIYVGAIILGYLFFDPSAPHFQSRFNKIKTFTLSSTVALLLYLPWFLWVWNYYGTPIPHTITAKGLHLHFSFLELFGKFLVFPLQGFLEDRSITATFLPIYFGHGGWSQGVILAAKVISLLCTYYWLIPSARPHGRAVSFALFVSHFYLSKVAAYVAPWYVPNAAILAVFVFGNILQHVIDVFGKSGIDRGDVRRWNLSEKLIKIVGGGVIVFVLSLTVAMGYELKIQQNIIENGNRKQIGLWLKENAASKNDSVFLECLGYIGFYSQLKMLDYPGLASQEVVSARRRLKTDDWEALICYLQPDWLVLRPRELADITKNFPQLVTEYYRMAKVFDVSNQLDAYKILPGSGYLRGDQIFVVYRIEPTRRAEMRALVENNL